MEAQLSVHSFDPEIAKMVGVNAAVIYQNILYWTEKNFLNNRHVRDGHVWTYNSVKAWGELFPYLTENQIRTALEKLVNAGLIEEGNHNDTAYDRTKWYGVKTQMHLGKITNGFGKFPKPIPDSKPDIKPTTLLGAGANDDISGLSDKLCQAAGITDETKTVGLMAVSVPLNWLENGCDLERDILPAIRAAAPRAKRLASWAYFTNAVFEARDRRLAPPPAVRSVAQAPPRPARQHPNAEFIEALARIAGSTDDGTSEITGG